MPDESSAIPVMETLPDESYPIGGTAADPLDDEVLVADVEKADHGDVVLEGETLRERVAVGEPVMVDVRVIVADPDIVGVLEACVALGVNDDDGVGGSM